MRKGIRKHFSLSAITLVMMFFVFVLPAHAEIVEEASSETVVSDTVAVVDTAIIDSSAASETTQKEDDVVTESQVTEAAITDKVSDREVEVTPEVTSEEKVVPEDAPLEAKTQEGASTEAPALAESEAGLADQAVASEKTLEPGSNQEEKALAESTVSQGTEEKLAIEALSMEVALSDTVLGEVGVEEASTSATLDVPTEDVKLNTTLEEGTQLDPATLAMAPRIFGMLSPLGAGNAVEVEVSSFEELKNAILNAGTTKTSIRITKSFELTEALTIGKDQDIILTANNQKPADGAWDPIKQPADYADQGEAKQREVIKEARERGEDALDKADLTKNPLPSEDKGDIIIKRADNFINDTLFKVLGKLTLGTSETALYIDGNKDVTTAIANKGSVIDVSGNLIMENATIMNSVNGHGYSGPITVQKNASFTMNGGRISSNESREKIKAYYNKPTAAGAVYVNPGATFNYNNGLIDNNRGGLAGGVFAGSLFGGTSPAIVNMNGGIIAKNTSLTPLQMGGGLTGFPMSQLNLKDGIVTGNTSSNGGGVAVSDQFIGEWSNIINQEFARTSGDYEKYITKNKAEANLAGGLLYKNKASTVGGGVYVDSNHVNFAKTMLLDNTAGNFGGGFYVSFPPRVQTLENLLVTENAAKATWTDYFGGGNGGGLWNCPTGYVHIGDGHTVYIYNNQSQGYGEDITFSKKTGYFMLNGENIKNAFYSHISPVTADGNIIKYFEDGTPGVDIPIDMSYTNAMTNLRAEYYDALIKEAWKNANTFILGNTARNGGGIGSNANMNTPQDIGNHNLKVKKKWDDSVGNIPYGTKIVADIFIVPIEADEAYVRTHYGIDPKLYKYGEIDLSVANNWEAEFTQNDYANLANLPANLLEDGLPFDLETLAARGYKYLVMEQGNQYHSKVVEIKPSAETTVEAGILEITRVHSKDQVSLDSTDPAKIFLYEYNEASKTMEMIGRSEVNDANNWTTTIASPLLTNKISKVEYYGKDRTLIENGENWASLDGYHVENEGYAFVLTKNEDGSLTLQVPYLWIQRYDTASNKSGFITKQLDAKEMQTVSAKDHEFIMTNYNNATVPVEKDWDAKVDKNKIPESIKVYLLLDGKRVVEKVDDQGNPIYRQIELFKTDDWKGQFDKLDPEAVAAGRYSIEEVSDIFAPQIVFVETKDTVAFKIGYVSTYTPIDAAPVTIGDQTLTPVESTSQHFKNFVGDVSLNLYVDGNKVETQQYIFTKIPHPFLSGEYTYSFNKDNAFFRVEDLALNGTDLRIDTYDVVTNEPGLTNYDFYIKKDDKGLYTLYLPRLLVNGVPYELFRVEDVEAKPNTNNYHEELSVIKPEISSRPIIHITNYDGPNHEIEIIKEWINGQDKVPEEITVIVTNSKNERQEITLSKGEGWKKTISDLEGTLRGNGYSISEVKVPNFEGTMTTEKTGIILKGQNEDGEATSLPYMNDTIKKILASGKYRYEVFENANPVALSKDNLEALIRIVKNEDGSYVIQYAKNVNLTEQFSVKLTNTHTPEKPPGTPPGNPGTGDLVIAKKVVGEDKSDKSFNFKLELHNPSGVELAGSYAYEIRENVKNAVSIISQGNIKSGDWFKLKDGQSIKIKGLPYGVLYRVYEDMPEGYRVDVSNGSGEISRGTTYVNFTNTYIPPDVPPETPEEPPSVPPETPEEPPSVPPETPEEPPSVPPDRPEKPGDSPKTGDAGANGYLLIALLGLLSIALLERRIRG